MIEIPTPLLSVILPFFVASTATPLLLLLLVVVVVVVESSSASASAGTVVGGQVETDNRVVLSYYCYSFSVLVNCNSSTAVL